MNKDMNLRISKESHKIFDAYVYAKNLKRKKRMTKRMLIEAYANRLMREVPESLLKRA